MKVLLISDSHGMDRYLKKALEQEGVSQKLPLTVDYILHCGDIEGKERMLQRIYPGPCCIVAGNCDRGSKLPAKICFDLEGHRILITHGHRQGVGYDYEGLLREARMNFADIVCFGHIHRPVDLEMEGIHIFNPGSISLPRQSDHRHTYMILNITRQQVTAELKYVE